MCCASHRQRIPRPMRAKRQCVQNVFKKDIKWPQMDNSVQHIGAGNECVSNGSLAASGQCLPALIYRWGKNWDETGLVFASVGCLPNQLILCVAYLQRCWNLHFLICLLTLRNRLIYVLIAKGHTQQIPRAVTLLVTPITFPFTLNSSINSVSKADRVVRRNHWFHLPVCSPSDNTAP